MNQKRKENGFILYTHLWGMEKEDKTPAHPINIPSKKMRPKKVSLSQKIVMAMTIIVAKTIVILLAIPQDREDDRMTKTDMAIPHIFDCRSSPHRLQT